MVRSGGMHGVGIHTAGIRDVAKRAGVSVGTVSNVFNRPEMVATETRQRVQDAVVALRYVRNESARQLRMGQSRTVGLIVPDIANPFFTDLARGVEDVTSAAGALVIMCNSDDGQDKEARYLTMLAEQQVLGVLLVPIASSAAAADALSDRGVPVVLLDYEGRTRRQCSVSVNDRRGGELAVGHLLAGGRRRVAFVGAGSQLRQAKDRLYGARQAVVDAGGREKDLVVLPAPALNVAGGVAAAHAWLDLPPEARPDAVACVNDLLAIGLLQGLLRAGVGVPDDVAIIGYDDISFAGSAAVPLSSIRQPRNELGRRAAELLLDEATDPEHAHARVVFEPILVVRDSSA